MNTNNPLQDFLGHINNSLNNNTFISVSLGNYKGNDQELKNIYLKKIKIKQEEKFSFVYKYQTKDITQNFDLANGIQEIKSSLTSGFNVGNLFTTENDFQFERLPNAKIRLKKSAPTKSEIPDQKHDHIKKRLIEANGNNYLTELGITDAHGEVFKRAQDKYRQINQYIHILSSMIDELPQTSIINVADMGSGKGYLTFALYDYLTNVKKLNAKVTGVEYRSDMVALCTNIAKKTGFENLSFEEGTIENYEIDNTQVLIALHACDTATDDAISKGIQAKSELIVVAPCCHKQIRKSIEKGKIKNDLDFITRHGILMERQAEMVTDGIRALILEYFGYKTKIFQFVSDAHTPKNVMITAQLQKNPTQNKKAILADIEHTMNYFGIDYHHLKRNLGI